MVTLKSGHSGIGQPFLYLMLSQNIPRFLTLMQLLSFLKWLKWDAKPQRWPQWDRPDIHQINMFTVG